MDAQISYISLFPLMASYTRMDGPEPRIGHPLRIARFSCPIFLRLALFYSSPFPLCMKVKHPGFQPFALTRRTYLYGFITFATCIAARIR